ncbi:MAG: cell division protein FtsZ [Candidatus Anaerobiospirillum merdipullorum]|uniref:Cell division protein FtsZ n=1 Tax=Candidatus Anaerobiospirillum merdipullorum TaxID=2838450 RepID=A0A9E2NRR5_9GAMM|nr:cell division protein FtsZ [Candidatus Anaerobiospirillum merdipullorum]
MSDFKVAAVSNSAADTNIHPANNCVIRVIGVGGGGGNSLQHMINQSLDGVEFIAINTDTQALSKSTAPTKVQIGVKLTNGLGAGCDPNKGRKAAEESKEDIKKLLLGSDMVFITAGMGGGTGTGAAPIIAEIAKETGALTVAVVTKPFRFEGKRHMINAQAGISDLSKNVDSLIVIDNDKLLKNLGANVSIVNAFNEANDVLLNAVKGITDAITRPGYINLDFADVRTVLMGRGHAMIGNGMGKGANFVEDAVQHAIHSPLIEQVDIRSAAGLLVNARVNTNFPIVKWEEICSEIQSYADEEADCKMGLSFDDKLAEDEIAVTILITGISPADMSQGAESPAAVARNQASLRRNSTLGNAKADAGGFFSMAQNHALSGFGASTQPSASSATFSAGISAPTPAGGNDNSQVSPLSFGSAPSSLRPESGAQVQMSPNQAPTGGAEVPVGGVGQMSAAESQDLWSVPPILRNKAD